MRESDEIIMELLASIDDATKLHGKEISTSIKRNEPDKRISEAVVKSLDTVLDCTISYIPPSPERKERNLIILELIFNQPDEGYIELYGDLKYSIGAYKPRGCRVRFEY